MACYDAEILVAIVVLGMHRSGTSCLAGMLAAGGLASAGAAVRNWDNARGHHEMLDVVRLNEAVLASSGGHWLQPPVAVRWTDAQAAARDEILMARVGGMPALVKDPRTLLVLPFWRASSVRFHAIGIVRHPLAVARSQESWRGMPLEAGVALWTAHNRVLSADHAVHGYTLIDFEQPKATVVAAVLAAAREIDTVDTVDAVDAVALAAAYEEQLVHHDDDDGDVPDVPGLGEATLLYERLAGHRTGRKRGFPRAQLAQLEEHLRANISPLGPARAALAMVTDAASVLVPLVTALIKHRAYSDARTLIDEQAPRLDPGLADLLHGKLQLAVGDHVKAAAHLEAACAVAQPFHQARHLLPQALRGAGRPTEARAALARTASEALYAHGPLATLAEWSWLDGDRTAGLAEMARAIDAAPVHRRGRLRTRRAEWLIITGDHASARRELLAAIDEDPGYARSRDVLARLR